MKQVRISQLKSRLSAHLRAVEAGESLEILDRARPIARVIPPDVKDDELQVVAATRAFSELRSRRFQPLRLKMSSLDALRAERGSR